MEFTIAVHASIACSIASGAETYYALLSWKLMYIKAPGNSSLYSGLLNKKHTLSKIYFAKTTDAKSMSCIRMERKSL
jgi:hypothetical protein